jgi:hypothetical protein
MGKRKSGILDPDYRKAGWSQSRYAPKNSDTSITQLAAIFGVITAALFVFGIPWLLPETKSHIQSIYGLAVAAIIYAFAMGISGKLLRNREFRRLRKLHGLRTDAELNAPEVVKRRESAQQRAKAAGQFEHEVASLFRKLTKHQVHVVGGKSDGGVDIEIRDNDKIVGIVQCKQYREEHTLAPSHIRELSAVKAQRGVRIAYLVTTARFSAASREEAVKYGINLIDGVELVNLKSKADQKIFGQVIQ